MEITRRLELIEQVRAALAELLALQRYIPHDLSDHGPAREKGRLGNRRWGGPNDDEILEGLTDTQGRVWRIGYFLDRESAGGEVHHYKDPCSSIQGGETSDRWMELGDAALPLLKLRDGCVMSERKEL